MNTCKPSPICAADPPIRSSPMAVRVFVINVYFSSCAVYTVCMMHCLLHGSSHSLINVLLCTLCPYIRNRIGRARSLQAYATPLGTHTHGLACYWYVMCVLVSVICKTAIVRGRERANMVRTLTKTNATSTNPMLTLAYTRTYASHSTTYRTNTYARSPYGAIPAFNGSDKL